MDKKSIIGIAVVAVLFLGFAYMNTKEQEKYQQEMARWQAYQDSLAAAAAVTAPAAGEAVGRGGFGGGRRRARTSGGGAGRDARRGP